MTSAAAASKAGSPARASVSDSMTMTSATAAVRARRPAACAPATPRARRGEAACPERGASLGREGQGDTTATSQAPTTATRWRTRSTPGARRRRVPRGQVRRVLILRVGDRSPGQAVASGRTASRAASAPSSASRTSTTQLTSATPRMVRDDRAIAALAHLHRLPRPARIEAVAGDREMEADLAGTPRAERWPGRPRRGRRARHPCRRLRRTSTTSQAEHAPAPASRSSEALKPVGSAIMRCVDRDRLPRMAAARLEAHLGRPPVDGHGLHGAIIAEAAGTRRQRSVTR